MLTAQTNTTMPDLTNVTYYGCIHNHFYSVEINGSNGTYNVQYTRQFDPNRKYEYDWQCTCASFKHKRGTDKDGYCKHIREVKASGEKCDWHEAIDGGSAVEVDGEVVCPKCGRETIVETWTV